MNQEKKTKLRFSDIANKNFLILFVAYTIICITHSMTNATVATSLKSVGMDMKVIGVISSVMGWAAFVIRPFSAPIVDRGNKKIIYVIAVALFTGAIFLYSQITVNTGFAVPAKILHGIAWTFISTVTAVILTEYVPRNQYGTALGFFMVSQMIASAVSEQIAFALANVFGYQSMFIIFTVVSIVGLLLLLFIAPTKSQITAEKSFFSGLKLNNLFAKEAILPMFVNVAYQGTRSGIAIFMATFALEELGIANVGMFALFGSLICWVARPLLGTLLDKRGALITLIPAGISYSLGLLCLAIAPNMLTICIAGILVGFGQGGIGPVLMAISMRVVPEERKAAANATNYLGMDLGSAVASIAGTYVVATFGYRIGFAAFIVPVALVTVIAAVFLSRNEKNSAQNA